MKGKTYIIEASGSIREESHDKPLTLEWLQSAAGGYIQLIPHFKMYKGEQCVVFGDEDGKIKGKPINTKATDLWRKQGILGDVLVGDIVVVIGDRGFMNAL
jgi:hypothetical protein